MGKRKAVQGGSRRCRLQISGGPDGAAEEADPIAEAVKAKRQRREAELRAAAKAAASAAAATLVTWFDDMDTVKAFTHEEGSRNQRPAHVVDYSGSADNGAHSPGTPPNPLASLIGYSGHDSDEEAASPSATAEAQQTEDSSGAPATGGEKDKVDVFFEELESKGLLKDDDGGVDGGDDHPAVDTTAATVATSESEAGAGDVNEAEQKVLETLAEDPVWQKVLDTDSGKVYFWNQETNEVTWEPPPLEPESGVGPSPAESSDAGNNMISEAAEGCGDGDGETEQEVAADDGEVPGDRGDDSSKQTEESTGNRKLHAQLDSAENAVSRIEETVAAWLAFVPAAVRVAIVARARLDDAKELMTVEGGFAGVAHILKKLDVAALSADMEKPTMAAQPPVKEAETAAQEAEETNGCEEGEIVAAATSPGQDMEVDMECEAPMSHDDSKEKGNEAAEPGQAGTATPAEPKPTDVSAATAYNALGYNATAAAAAAAATGYHYPSVPASGAEVAAYHSAYHYAYAAAAYSAAYNASLTAGSYPHANPPPLPEEPPPKLPGEESPPRPPDEPAESVSCEPEARQPSEPAPGTIDNMAAGGPSTSQPIPSDVPAQPSGSGVGVSEGGSSKSKKDGVVNGSKKKGARKLPKGASSLLNKWEAVRNAEREAEETAARAEEEKFDVEAQKKKREREIEEWRFQQLATGEADGNANFQPLNGDWREKVKRAKQSGDVSKADKTVERAQPASGQSFSGKPDLVAAARGLPPGWQPMWDKTSGEVYYGNLSTGVTTWERPTA